MLGFIIPKTLLKHTDVIFYMTCITVKEFLKLKSQYPILVRLHVKGFIQLNWVI